MQGKKVKVFFEKYFLYIKKKSILGFLAFRVRPISWHNWCSIIYVLPFHMASSDPKVFRVKTDSQKLRTIVDAEGREVIVSNIVQGVINY